jgi:phosphoribosyl isomerase A
MSWAEAHDTLQPDARPPFGVWSVARTLARVSFTLLPAVDVADGQAVRLVQGEAGTETGYGDPLDAALAWQRDGAEWIHLVDLDAAFGRGSNAELLAGVVGTLDVAVELSGGIRDDASLDRALATGCARVNLGTAALENPQWCAKAIAQHGERIAVGLDVKISDGGHRLAARGWTTDGGDLWETLERLDRDGCARYVVTDVSKDGTLKGPNVELLRAVAAATPAPVIASGGIAEVADLVALAEAAAAGANIEGSIVGKALYAGRFTLPEALAAVAAVRPARTAAS